MPPGAAAPTPPAIHSHFEAARPVNRHCAASRRTGISPYENNRGHGIAIFRSAAIARKERRSPVPLQGNATCSAQVPKGQNVLAQGIALGEGTSFS